MVDAVKNYFLSRVPSCLLRLGNGVTTSNTERTCLNTHSTNTLTQFPTERLCRALSTQATLVPRHSHSSFARLYQNTEKGNFSRNAFSRSIIWQYVVRDWDTASARGDGGLL